MNKKQIKKNRKVALKKYCVRIRLRAKYRYKIVHNRRDNKNSFWKVSRSKQLSISVHTNNYYLFSFHFLSCYSILYCFCSNQHQLFFCLRFLATCCLCKYNCIAPLRSKRHLAAILCVIQMNDQMLNVVL